MMNDHERAVESRWSPAIDEALAAPGGAQWHRVALQVNPYGYQGACQPANAFPNADTYNAALIAACTAAEITMIGITDHWAVDSAAALAADAEAAGIVALPGFEMPTSEGVHLLALFEHGTSYVEINAAIGECGGTPGAKMDELGGHYTDVVRCLTTRGALVIPAHINGPNGLLTTFAGQALAQRWKNDDVHAVAVSQMQLTDLQRQILENTEPTYRRTHEVAQLYADDICEPGRLASPGGSCWVKMSEPSLSALDLATRTPDTRVSRTDPHTAPHAKIVALAWEGGGFLDGVRLRPSGSLTCLVGGRGAGKSAMIESIRYALGVEPITGEAQKNHRDLIERALGAGAKVSMLVSGPDGEFLIERTVPEPPVVRDATGTALAARPEDVLGDAEVFSQHELAQLAGQPDYVAQVVDPELAGWSRRLRPLAKSLRQNRESIVALLHDRDEADDALAELPRLRDALRRFTNANLAERLQERSALDRERRLLDIAAERVDELSGAAAPLRDDGLLDAAFVADASLSELPNRATLARVRDVLGGLHTDLRGVLAGVDAAVTKAESTLSDVRRDWEAATSPARERFDEVLRELNAAGLDTSGYVATRDQVARLETLAEKRELLVKRLSALHADRSELLAEAKGFTDSERRRLAEACTRIGQELSSTAYVVPKPSKDRTEIEKLIESSVPGQRHQIKAAVNAAGFSPRALADAARQGPDELAQFSIRGAQAENLSRAGEEFFLKLEECQIGLSAVASLNVATGPKRDFRELNHLSAGQKATALLLILLSTRTGPLIIDQPEDDLDNRFVWEGVVPRLRALKGRRQLIFSTHNANIPVLGDAELLAVLEAQNGQGRTAAGGVGSLDDKTVLELAEEILEGGPQAFGRRRYLYGF